VNKQANWEQIWDRRMERSLRKWDDEEFWYERTRSRGYGIKTSDYTDQLLSRMDLSTDRSVLDIGCGDGAISVRLAKQSKQVSALDFYPSYLGSLTLRTMANGLSNLKFLNIDWFQAQIGMEIEPHDIVLASRFRRMSPLRSFLNLMNSASRYQCYLTWTVEYRGMDASICEILDREYYPLPDYSIICNMLESMGISSSVEVFKVTELHRFESESDAVDNAARGYKVETNDTNAQIASLVKSNLEVRDGFWWQESTVNWALVRWDK
jgi:SAM-dependent methyltransferase